jgi:hypothetical protein
MTKKYIHILTLVLLFSSLSMMGQENNTANTQPQPTEALSFYPNPITDGKLYITSKSVASREITVFDVLGKVVFRTTTHSKEINLQAIQPGIYMIRIKEGEQTSTKKLIIK